MTPFYLLALIVGATAVRKSRASERLDVQSGISVLKPNNTKLQPVGLIMNPGGTVDPSMYNDALAFWQSEAEKKGMSMWISTLEYFFDLSLPFRLKSRVGNAMGIMRRAGLPRNADMYFTGHSMGASASLPAQNELFEEGAWKGVILQAGYITRQFYPPMADKFWYGAPTLTIGGELNYGGSRVTRMAEVMYQHEQLGILDEYPVVVVEGMNHMQFATGFNDDDLKPEKSTSDCQLEVARLGVEFIAKLQGKSNGEMLRREVGRTKRMMEPLTTAFRFEGSRSFNVPNQADTPNNDCARGVCKGSVSGWVASAQKDVLDAKGFFPQSNYADLRSGRIEPYLSGKIAQAFVHSPFDIKEWEKDFMDPIANLEMAAEFVSRQAVHPEIKSDPDVCVQLNQKAYTYALENAGQKAMNRFKKVGQGLVFKPTIYHKTHKKWWEGALDFVEDAAGEMTVTSSGLLADGRHYCKLLTPARALEWIYVDGLAKQLMGKWEVDSAKSAVAAKRAGKKSRVAAKRAGNESRGGNKTSKGSLKTKGSKGSKGAL